MRTVDGLFVGNPLEIGPISVAGSWNLNSHATPGLVGAGSGPQAWWSSGGSHHQAACRQGDFKIRSLGTEPPVLTQGLLPLPVRCFSAARTGRILPQSPDLTGCCVWNLGPGWRAERDFRLPSPMGPHRLSWFPPGRWGELLQGIICWPYLKNLPFTSPSSG